MNKITIYIAGDSTAADYPDAQLPMNGWGQALPQFVTDKVQVVNAASPGRSSKSFIEEGRLDEIERRIG